MLLSHETQVLQRAVLAAVRNHRPQVLRHLLMAQGAEHFALSLQGQPFRVVEDALSMLSPSERCTVIGQRTFDGSLLKAAREGRLRAISARASHVDHKPAPFCGAGACEQHRDGGLNAGI
ncbi:MAG: hypothetical protein JO369_02735 [Paucibacter sp.]|nr:hypothetical protein [Roseateles sp.]